MLIYVNLYFCIIDKEFG